MDNIKFTVSILLSILIFAISLTTQFYVKDMNQSWNKIHSLKLEQLETQILINSPLLPPASGDDKLFYILLGTSLSDQARSEIIEVINRDIILMND